jgi:hypothetical protein
MSLKITDALGGSGIKIGCAQCDKLRTERVTLLEKIETEREQSAEYEAELRDERDAVRAKLTRVTYNYWEMRDNLRAELERVTAERDERAKLRADLARVTAERDILRQALVTISLTGVPGGAIAARRSDGHACAWCRGAWVPCPAEVARQALNAAKETR